MKTPKLTRHLTISSRAILWLCVMGAAINLGALQPFDQARPTGLRMPTEAEWQWMEKNMIKVGQVRLNQLAVGRINTGRSGRELVPLKLDTVEFGQEVMPLGPGAVANAAGAANLLPAEADNSLLPSFPEVRNQGNIGSCASFSTVYYTATHMAGLPRGWNNKNPSNALKFSPKWTYPMINDGQDNGSWFTPTIDVLLKHGAATWADFPYSGDNVPSSYREWSRTANVWRNALSYRMSQSGMVTDIHTDVGRDNLKTLLANGYVLLYATDIYGWQFVNVANDPATSADDPYVGQRACAYVKAEASGHAMTVVGYNDNLWIDINKNGAVDNGEKGAFKICNSWGSGWENSGFAWISYDALRTPSMVSGAAGLQSNRAPGNLGSQRTGWWYNQCWYFTAQASYAPKLLGQFTLNHARRSELSVRLGRSATSTTSPQIFFQAAALQNQGGTFAFDGGSSAVSGTFVLDFSDLAANGPNRYYLLVSDNAAGNSTTLSDFRLTDASGNVLATASGLPKTVDGTETKVWLDLDSAAPIITSASTATGQVAVAFSYNVTASGNPASFSAVGLPPGLNLNTANGLISGTPTQAGIFTATVNANGPSGSGSGSLVITITSQPGPAPGITSSLASTGMVGQTFAYSITASNSPTSFGANPLPAGLSVNTGTGLISGVPTTPGSFVVEIQANNGSGTGRRNLALTILPPAGAVPVITSADSVTATAGSPFAYRITAANNPTSFNADGLPDGLAINTANGQISGTLSVARQYAIFLRAANAVGTGYMTLTLTVLGGSSFGPANDAFENRALLLGTNLAIAAGNANATTQTNEPSHGGLSPSKSVWWTWTAPVNGTVVLSTLGSDFDTVLAVYAGVTLASLQPVAANDDDGTNRSSRVAFNATGGTAYQIAVDGYGGSQGSIRLGLVFTGTTTAPGNDLFGNAVNLVGTTISTNGANAGAAAEPSEPAHAGFTARKSVWWTWTAPVSGPVQVSTVGSDFDTVLAIYTGTSVAALSPVASDDESGGNNTSLATFNASAGTVYRIAVDGYNGASGRIVLNVQVAGGITGNDNFENRAVLSGASLSVAAQNSNATQQASEPLHAGSTGGKSVWWSWTAPVAGVATVDTIGSSFDTLLAVYSGSSLSALAPVAANDDTGNGLTSSVTFNVAQGATYQIAVDGYNGASGAISLQVQLQAGRPANDDFANAISLTGSSFAAYGANFSATWESGEPDHAGEVSLQSVWWKWAAPARGQMTITTAGSSIDSVMAVYAGSSLSQLRLLGANDDDWATDALTSRVTFFAETGVVYYLAVDSYDLTAGTIVLTGSLETNAPTLYATDFESFLTGSDTLGNADGWMGVNLGNGVEGIYAAFTGQRQAGYLGGGFPAGSLVSIWRPVNFSPLSQGRPIVTFATDLAIVDSSNGAYDRFYLTFYNRAGEVLSRLSFNNASNRIFYFDGQATTDPGLSYINSTKYHLEWQVDYQANRCWLTLDDRVILTNTVFHAGGKTLDLGDVDLEWAVANAAAPGDNFLAFDNYLVKAEPPLVAPVIVTGPRSATVEEGAMATLSVVASGSGPLRYQWQFNGTNLAGATNSAMVLVNVAASQTGLYRATVANRAGNAASTNAALTVIQPQPTARLGRPIVTSRGVQIQATGPAGRTYKLEVSADLLNWSEAMTVVNQNGAMSLLDSLGTNNVRKFYRMHEVR